MGADLITLDEYKTSEKIESLKNDTRLQSLITSVSQLVKTYCANTFVDYYDVDKTETFTLNWPTGSIQPSDSPLISVSLVEERANFGSDYTTLSAENLEYYVDLETDTIYRTDSTGFSTWAMGPGSVRVTYRAGYSEVPDDLKLAVIDLVNYYFHDEYKPNRAFAGVSITNETSSTQWRNVSFPDHIKRILDLYKTVRL
jgi:hypothetical protein